VTETVHYVLRGWVTPEGGGEASYKEWSVGFCTAVAQGIGTKFGREEDARQVLPEYGAHWRVFEIRLTETPLGMLDTTHYPLADHPKVLRGVAYATYDGVIE
jgi:hypothetical protein